MATRKGYGQVEPNHLSAQHNGQIYAQLPAKTGTTKISQLENGQFLKYDYAAGEAHTTGDIEWMLVYNEEKLYDERFQNHKDFAMKASDMTDGIIYPRLLKTHVGDIFTTNTFRTAGNTPATVTGPNDTITIPDLAVRDYLDIDTAGWLKKATGTTKPESGIVFQVVKVYTMPDGQFGVKIQRIQ